MPIFVINANVLKTRSIEGVADEVARKVARSLLKTLDERELKENEQVTVVITRTEAVGVA